MDEIFSGDALEKAMEIKNKNSENICDSNVMIKRKPKVQVLKKKTRFLKKKNKKKQNLKTN